MASLLSKFRIDYSDLKVIPNITKKPQESTKQFFDSLIVDFTKDKEGEEDSGNLNLNTCSQVGFLWVFCVISAPISESELLAMKDKTNRHLRLRELLLENSSEANLIVMYEFHLKIYVFDNFTKKKNQFESVSMCEWRSTGRFYIVFVGNSLFWGLRYKKTI